jgi:hypothetical protein
MLPNPSPERPFADEVAEATGLAPMFSKGVIERCCKRVGMACEALQPGNLEKLLPHLESALLVYKTGREVMAALDRLKRLVAKDIRRLRATGHSTSLIWHWGVPRNEHEEAPFVSVPHAGRLLRDH